MNTGTVVLFAAVVVLVLALVAWLLLRRRESLDPVGSGGYAAQSGAGNPASDASGGAATGWQAAGHPAREPAAAVDTSPDPTAADPEAASDGPHAAREPGNPIDPSDSDDDSVDFHEQGSHERGSRPQDSDQQDPPLHDPHQEDSRQDDLRGTQLLSEGAEFADDGLSVLGRGESEDQGEVSGTAPRTPTEAFGEAHDPGPAADVVEAPLSGSPLDGPGSDSTPLFRSMREQLMTSAETPMDPVEDAVYTRQVSELHEVVDGGFGIGSAAPIADGAQPLGHPIKADRRSKVYHDLHSGAYEEAEVDVWFLDPGFAERAGFRRAD